MANEIKASWVENLPQTFLRETVSLLEFIAFFGTMVAMWHFGAAQSVWLWMAVGAPLLIVGVIISALVRTRLGLVKGRFER